MMSKPILYSGELYGDYINYAHAYCENKNCNTNMYLYEAPLDRLPSHILRYIMLLGDEEPDDPYEISRDMGSTMACTSQRLRTIAIKTPSLWTHISNAFSWEEINRRFVRSVKEPLKLDFWLSDASIGKTRSMWFSLALLRKNEGFDIVEIRFKAPLDGSFSGRRRREWCAYMHGVCSYSNFDSLRKVAVYDKYGSRPEDHRRSAFATDMDLAPTRQSLTQPISPMCGGDILRSTDSTIPANAENFNFSLLWKAGGLREVTYHYALPEAYEFETRHVYIHTFTCVLRGQKSELRQLAEILPCMRVLECLNVKLGVGHEWDLLAFEKCDRATSLGHKSINVRSLKQLSVETTAELGVTLLLALDAPSLEICKMSCCLSYATVKKARAMTRSMGIVNTFFALRMMQVRGSAGLYEYLDLPSRLMSETSEDLQCTEDKMRCDLNPALVSPKFGKSVIANFAVVRREEDMDPMVSVRLSTFITSAPITRVAVENCASGSADNHLLRHVLECNLCNKCK